MSRIGKRPVPVPDNVTIESNGPVVSVTGPRGTVSRRIPDLVTVDIAAGVITLTAGEDGRSRSMHGLARTLVANMVEGVTTGFRRRLEIIGVGYKAEAQDQGRTVRLNLGYSHPIVYAVSEGISVATPTPTAIEVQGADKELVGQVAADLRAYRPTEPYKGKGIKYEGEIVRRKAGKTGV